MAWQETQKSCGQRLKVIQGCKFVPFEVLIVRACGYNNYSPRDSSITKTFKKLLCIMDTKIMGLGLIGKI